MTTVLLSAATVTAGGVQQPLSAALAGGVPYTSPGGIVARSAVARAADVKYVRDFGGVFDGNSHPLSFSFSTLAAAQAVYPFVTALTQEQDWAALQAAILACDAAKGGVVHLPFGSARIGSTILLSRPNTILQGYGFAVSAIVTNNQNFDLFQTVAGCAQIELRDFGFVGFGTPTSGWFLNDAGADYTLRMSHIQAIGTYNGIYSAAAGFKAEDVRITGVIGTGIALAGNVEAKDIISCFFGGTGGTSVGASITQGLAITFLNTELTGFGSNLVVRPSTGTVAADMVFIGTWFDSAASNNVVLDGTAGQDLNIRMDACWITSSGSNGVAISGTVKGLSITGGTEIDAALGNGIDVAVGSTVTALMLDGVKSGGNGGSALGIEGSTIGTLVVTSCVLGPHGNYGANGHSIYCVDNVSADRILIAGNMLAGNTSAKAVSVSGANSVVANNVE